MVGVTGLEPATSWSQTMRATICATPRNTNKIIYMRVTFFKTPQRSIIATESTKPLSAEDTEKLCWLYGGAEALTEEALGGHFVGPRREMVTPWSTNAVEITQNMGLKGIARIEEYFPVGSKDADHDPMLQRMYDGLDQTVFTTNIQPAPIMMIDDLETYNEQEGLALSAEEIEYLHGVEKQLGRKLTDSEVFGFAQISTAGTRSSVARSS